LQRHYAILQALALEEDELPETKDETMPDEEGMQRYHLNDGMICEI
jgi:ATP-dependent DNA helicase 2 subunit 1